MPKKKTNSPLCDNLPISCPNGTTPQKNKTNLLKNKINLWRSQPEKFVEHVFGAKPEKWQARVLQSLVEHDKIAIRSGHGVGKTALLSWIIFWWLLTRFPAKAACTAPTAHQLSDVLWGELAKWHRKMPEPLGSLFQVQSDRVCFKQESQNAFAVARTARKEQPEAFQGFHATHMLFLIDEASAVDDIIFEVGQGAMSTKGAKTLMVGNPTRTQGYFYDAFHKNRSQWQCFRVSCLDSSQVDKKYAHHMSEAYGEDSYIYRVRVLGEFPKAEVDVLIPLHLCESATQREIPDSEHYPVWGVDIARFGHDASALVKRQGSKILEPPLCWHNKDTMQMVGLIVEAYNATDHSQKPQTIYVDAIGIGAGVVDRLHELGLPVCGVNVAEQPSVKDRYERLRDELWFRARAWLEQRQCYIPNHAKLIAELTAPRFKYTSQGKVKVESKDEMKKRGLTSPDIADAFCLTFAGGYDMLKPLESTHSTRSKKRYFFGQTWMSS